MLQVKQVSFPQKNFGICAASSLQDALLLLNQQCRATFSSNNGTFLLFADHTQPFASSSTARMLVDYCSALCFVSWCTLNSCGGDLRSTLLVVIVHQPFKTETWNWVWFFIHFSVHVTVDWKMAARWLRLLSSCVLWEPADSANW